METLWKHYVVWLSKESNWLYTESLLQKIHTSECPAEQGIYEKIYQILENFFQEMSAVGLSCHLGLVSRPNFEHLPEDDKTDNMRDMFVTRMRYTVQNYYVQSLGAQQTATCSADKIYYDGEYVYFPSDLFDSVLHNLNMAEKKKKLLSELKHTGFLKISSEGYTSKKRIDGKRIPVYAIKQPCFYRFGEVNFTDLGKEII